MRPGPPGARPAPPRGRRACSLRLGAARMRVPGAGCGAPGAWGMRAQRGGGCGRVGCGCRAQGRGGLLQRIWRKMVICFEIPRQSAPLARQCADPHRRDLGKRALRRWQGGLGESGSSEFRRKWPKNASRRARPRASRSHAPARPTRPRAPHARVPRPGATAPRRCRSGSGPWRSAPRCRLPLSPRSRGTGRWPASRSRCGTAGTT